MEENVIRYNFSKLSLNQFSENYLLSIIDFEVPFRRQNNIIVKF